MKNKNVFHSHASFTQRIDCPSLRQLTSDLMIGRFPKVRCRWRVHRHCQYRSVEFPTRYWLRILSFQTATACPIAESGIGEYSQCRVVGCGVFEPVPDELVILVRWDTPPLGAGIEWRFAPCAAPQRVAFFDFCGFTAAIPIAVPFGAEQNGHRFKNGFGEPVRVRSVSVLTERIPVPPVALPSVSNVPEVS